MGAPASPCLPPLDIIEEHFESLDFLGEQRERHVFAAHWTLRELGDIEERCEAHADGLRLAGDVAIDVARIGFASEEPGAAAAAARLFLTLDRPDVRDEVLALFAAGAPPVRDGIRVAMRHCDVGPIETTLRGWTASDNAALRVAAADVLAFHRRPLPSEIDLPVRDPDPHVAALACGVIGRRGGPWSPEDLESALAASHPELRRAALVAAAKLGMSDLAARCRRAASDSSAPSAEAIEFLGVVGDPSDLPLFTSALREPPLAAAAVAGLGALGYTLAVPILIDAMLDSAAKQEAGAAFLRITTATGFAGRSRHARTPASNEEDSDNESAIDPEWARSFWKEREPQFDKGVRWQAGRPIDPFPNRAVFDTLPLQSRRAIWLGARAMRRSDAPDLELEASAALQRR